METIYDWLTVALFAALVVTFLQRSAAPPDRPASAHDDRMIHYLPPAIGCAVVNHLGNGGRHVAAVLLLGAVLAYVWRVIRPGRAGV